MHRKALIPEKSINGFLIFCLIILLAYYVYSICTSPFTIFHWDPLNGFLALKNFEAGGPFNYIHSVLATDVSKTKVEWLSWWSPGQYMIPYFFQTIGHLSFINSVKATVIISMLVFVPGVIGLFGYFNFSLRVSLFCVLIFLVQRMIFINTWGYDGGDILFICFLPWYLRGFLYLYDSGNFLFQFLSIFLLTLFAVFIKLTFIVVAISLLLFLLLNSFVNRNDVKTNIMSVFSVKNVSAGLGILFALGVVYVIFLSKGINPNQLNGIHFLGKDSLELLFMPISIFSFTGLTTFLVAKSLAAAVFIYILLLFTVFVVCRMVMDFKNGRLKMLILSSGIVFFIYLFYSFNFAHVSGGDRHLRMISFLCLPVIVQYLLTRKANLIFFLLTAVICVGTAYSVFSVRKFKRQTISHPVVGIRGFDYHTQVGESVSREMLDTLIRIDNEGRDAIFLTNNYHWALDMKNSRFGVIDGDFMGQGFAVKPPPGSNIYILLSTDLFYASWIARENKQSLKTVFQSGDNILVKVITE